MAKVTQRDRVLDYFKDHPNARAPEIADYLGTSVNSTRVLLFGMVHEGSLTKIERGLYGRSNEETPTQPISSMEDFPIYKKDLLTAKPHHGVVESRLDRAIKPEPLPESLRVPQESVILTYLKGKENGYRATRRELLKLGATNRDVKNAVKQGYLSQYKSDGSYHLTEKN